MEQSIKIFSKEMAWSVRCLTIYNLSQDQAKELVMEIVRDLATISWDGLTDKIRKQLFALRLERAVVELKHGQ